MIYKINFIEGLLFASAWVSAEEYKADTSEAPKADAETTTGMISKAVFVDFFHNIRGLKASSGEAEVTSLDRTGQSLIIFLT